MIEVIVLTREDCPLCVQIQKDLQALNVDFPHHINIINVDSNDELRKQYGDSIPVLMSGTFILKSPISQQELRTVLESVSINEKQTTPVKPADQLLKKNENLKWTKSDRFSYWLTKHYLGIFNTIVFLFILLPFLAPVMLKAGLDGPATIIYKIYGTTCHQFAFRSFFLFGDQWIYPRAAANLSGLESFSQASGLSEGNSPEDIFTAREFYGNKDMGYKIALCERDIAIYLGILGFGIFFGLTKRKIPGLAWYWWVLFGLIPIGIDGLSQLLSQPPFGFIPYRESTVLIRTLTGLLFGITTAWFGIPLVEQSMVESREMLEAKKAKTKLT